jgi:hypothetical protein
MPPDHHARSFRLWITRRLTPRSITNHYCSWFVLISQSLNLDPQCRKRSFQRRSNWILLPIKATAACGDLRSTICSLILIKETWSKASDQRSRCEAQSLNGSAGQRRHRARLVTRRFGLQKPMPRDASSASVCAVALPHGMQAMFHNIRPANNAFWRAKRTFETLDVG